MWLSHAWNPYFGIVHLDAFVTLAAAVEQEGLEAELAHVLAQGNAGRDRRHLSHLHEISVAKQFEPAIFKLN